MYRVTSILYSSDGKRAAEFREFDNGETYLLETDWVEETTFNERARWQASRPFRLTETSRTRHYSYPVVQRRRLNSRLSGTLVSVQFPPIPAVSGVTEFDPKHERRLTR